MIDLLSSEETEVDIDFSDEISGLTAAIVLAEQCGVKWSEINISGLRSSLDDQALSITESKEEYLQRRKVLAGTVREFKQQFAPSGDDWTLQELKSQADKVIDTFKKEYDHLSTMCKAAETSFMFCFKTFRDVPDPHDLVKSTLAAAETALDGFRRVEDIFTKLENSQAETEAQSQVETASGTTTMHEGGGDNLIKNNEEFQARLQVGMVEVASSYDTELKKREQILRDTFEQQKLQAQQKFDSILAQKDAELMSLHETLQSQELALSWNSENQLIYQAEAEKRTAMEDKLRQTQRSYEDLVFTLEDYKVKQTEDEAECHRLRQGNDTLTKEVDRLEHEQRRQADAYADELSVLQRTLHTMPSFDLSSLADKLGMSGKACLVVGDSASDHVPDLDLASPSTEADSGDDKPLPQKQKEAHTVRPVQWVDIEEWLISTVRTSQSEASELRVREQEREQCLESLEVKVNALTTEVDEKRQSITILERDLTTAYSSIEAGKALLRCHKIVDSSKSTDPSSSGSSSQSSVASLFQMGGAAGSGGDVEGGGSSSKDVMMMKAVLEQRDRMMKQAHSKEQEAAMLQLQVERLENDKRTLKVDNTELYKRLRVIRVNNSGNGSSSHGSGLEVGNYSHTSIKKRTAGDYDDGDDIEAKYSQQYEEHIDLFQLEALDRQAVLSRMSMCEKGLSYFVRFVMQDKWLRHALLVYLLVVHVFALGYVLVVLNPDIEREIDEQWSRISKEEENHEIMHPDNWMR